MQKQRLLECAQLLKAFLRTSIKQQQSEAAQSGICENEIPIYLKPFLWQQGRDVHFSSKTRISSHHYSVTHKQKPILDRQMKLYLRAINLSCINPVWHISHNIFSKQLFPDISHLTCRALLFHFFVCQFSGVVLLPLYCFALCKNLLTPQRNIFPSNRGRKNK